MSRQSKMARKRVTKKQASQVRKEGGRGPYRTQKVNRKVNVWWKKGKNEIGKPKNRGEDADA